MNEVYRKQVSLLLDILPEVAKEDVFALHGGTAINLFCLDMPRLSVDIDLTYIHSSENRDNDLQYIRSALVRIKERLSRKIPSISFADSTRANEELKLICTTLDAMVKIEVNQFKGMTDIFFGYSEYENTRELLIRTVNESLTKEDKEFLLAFTKGEPDWSKRDYSKYPAIRWKLRNIAILKETNLLKHKEQIETLKHVLLCFKT